MPSILVCAATARRYGAVVANRTAMFATPTDQQYPLYQTGWNESKANPDLGTYLARRSKGPFGAKPLRNGPSLETLKCMVRGRRQPGEPTPLPHAPAPPCRPRPLLMSTTASIMSTTARR